jgi:inosose dehydratase
MSVSRRELLRSAAVAAAVFAIPSRAVAWGRAARLKFGYAAITWNGNDLLAIDEISALGYPGIQIRTSVFRQFGNNPDALRDLLARKNLTLVAFSSGSVKTDPAAKAATIAEHVANARFVRDAGGLFLQLTDERPAGRAVTSDDCARLGELLTTIGKRTFDVGVPVAYHPHMGTIGEKPDDLERILAATDPRYVRLLLDVAHYAQGGGDPAAAIRRYDDDERLAFLHLKDVESMSAAPYYRFVELGRGRVNLGAVFDALSETNYEGWAVVELDDVAGSGHTAGEAAAANKRYLESRGFSVR